MRAALISALAALLASGPAAGAVTPPRSMLSPNPGFLSHGLGSACYAFDLAADTLPCLPAHLAKDRERRFRANFHFGNHVTYADEARRLLDGDADQGTIRSLFEKREASELEAGVEAGYSTGTFGVAVTPLRLNYYTLFRSSALPEVTVFARQEQSARVQFASAMGRDLFWGLQARYLQRKFIADRFFLTDVLAEDGEKIFDPRGSRSIFLEPGILYSREDGRWNPELSASLSGLRAWKSGDDGIQDLPQARLSGSVQPDIGWGRWGFGFDYAWDTEVREWSDPFTLGTYYRFGILTLFASIAEDAAGAGFSVLSGPFNIGLTSSQKTIDAGDDERETYRRIHLLLGIEI